MRSATVSVIAGVLIAGAQLASAATAMSPRQPNQAQSTNSGGVQVTIAPDACRSLQSNSGPFSLTYSPLQGPIPPECPANLTGLKFDSVSEIIADYTPAGGGSNTNACGEGMLGYWDYGPTPGTLNCTTTVPPITALTDTSIPYYDGTAVLRYPLAGIDLAKVSAAAIEIHPTTQRKATWLTYSVTGCKIDTGVVSVLGLDREPAVAPDCIMDERDFGGFVSFIQVHDVLLSINDRNPTVNQWGGRTDLGLLHNQFDIPGMGISRNVTIPLTESALKVIRAGGEPAGYLEVLIKMGDERGAFSEGPTVGAREAALGILFMNHAVIEDRDGIWYADPALSASTDLILTVG